MEFGETDSFYTDCNQTVSKANPVPVTLIKLQNRELVTPKVLKKPGEKAILKQNFQEKEKHKDHRRASNKQ